MHDDKILEILYKKVYKGFVQHIDGIDNGIPSMTGEKNYAVTTSLSARVGYLNPGWNDEQSEEIEMNQFKKAMALTYSEFAACVNRYVTSWLPARTIVESCFKSRESENIIVFKQFCPWKSHLFYHK